MVFEAIERGWENFVARSEGPLSLRLIMQPAVAAFLAIRAGLKDARDHRPPFLWSTLTTRGGRWARFRGGLSDVSKVFIAALVLDSIYQILVVKRIYALELLFTSVVLAFVPYIALRGPVNRLATRAKRSKGAATWTTRTSTT